MLEVDKDGRIKINLKGVPLVHMDHLFWSWRRRKEWDNLPHMSPARATSPKTNGIGSIAICALLGGRPFAPCSQKLKSVLAKMFPLPWPGLNFV